MEKSNDMLKINYFCKGRECEEQDNPRYNHAYFFCAEKLKKKKKIPFYFTIFHCN